MVQGLAQATSLLAGLRASGFAVGAEGGTLRVIGPKTELTPERDAAIRSGKSELLQLLHREALGHWPAPGEADATTEAVTSLACNATVTINGHVYPYERPWTGRPLAPPGDYLSFDTETAVVDLLREVPALALASASAGRDASSLLHPDQVGDFILAHRDCQVVCHNASFDFWVLEQHLRLRGEEQALAAWWQMVEDNRLHCSMLLDMLVRLARDDRYPEPRNLGVVAREYAGLEIDKEDPYRLRYGEVIGRPWDTVEDGFFTYAIADAIVTLPVYQALREKAEQLLARFGDRGKDIFPDAVDRFGLLTEAIQVKKAIALAQVTRSGMHLDLERLRPAEADLRRRLADVIAEVRSHCPSLYKVNKNGDLVFTKAGAPSRSNTALAGQLALAADAIEEQTGETPDVPRTAKTRKPSTSSKFWAEYVDHDPFLRAWVQAEGLAKELQFYRHLKEEKIHPHYTVMVRSGRTSCARPNVQQVPRGGPLRKAFIPGPGHLLLAVDYSFIELRTLAAHCLHRYGWSDLADTIKAGVDPHANTAAMVLDVPLEAFGTWKSSASEGQREKYTSARQAAKAINFGVPGGLGAKSLAAYARASYNVPLTLEEAQGHREVLTKRVYKELDHYLAADVVALVARNLRASPEEVRASLGDIHLTCVRKVLTGNPKKQDGTPYQAAFVDRIWAALAKVNRDPDLKEALERRQPSERLARHVCQAGVATLTGRIRGRVRYSQARNSPFQGLAADGAALALFALVKEGFRVVGFVHDEILVELPDEGGCVSEAQVCRVTDLMCREMERVLHGGIPVEAEATLCRCWDKKAKCRTVDGRVFPEGPVEDSAGKVPGTHQDAAAGTSRRRPGCRPSRACPPSTPD
jgi:DNA polymerase I-like protein with 3'-5' exonuclease and polymerase domains